MDYSTSTYRTDVGMHPDDVFICVVVGRLGWSRPRIESDVYDQLMGRLNNARASADIRDGLVRRFDSRVNITKLIKDIQDGYKAAKDFTLSPLTIGKLCYGMLSGLATWAFIETDIHLDLNKNYFPSEEYFDFLLYSYLNLGKMQPKHREQ